MYLKSLELHGFKSFPDKTVLNFNSGTTVIVGPNGSGKSNMTDAMRWVLGELSSKNIRGSKMEDVIFAGAEGKKPMSFAEVSVTFDDSAEPKVLNTTYDEVTVTRRYYRNGDSEYFINKKKVRLKDIYEMFMNTGIGREGYSIIGQGRIAEIISKKSDERRSVFEESAGISKFRYRKHESEKKLAETEANMARVADIESELEARLGPLERDSEKARRYLEFYGEKKKVDVSLWLYDIDRIKKNIDKAVTDTNMSAHELEIAVDNIKQTEEHIDRLYTQFHDSKEMSQKVYDELTEMIQLKSDAEAQLTVSKNNIENADSRIESERSVAESIRHELSREKENADAVSETLAEVAEKYMKSCEERDSLLTQYTEVTASSRDRSDKISAALNEQKALESELTDIRIKRNVLAETLKSSDSRKSDIEADIRKYEEESKALSDLCEESRQQEEAYRQEIEAIDKEIKDIPFDFYEAETAKVQAKISLNRAEIDSHDSRITALRNMQDHFDGYYNSVRYVMQEKDKIGGIHGPVSYLIKVDKEYVVAVETALGAALQNIVTDDEDAAKRAIRALKNANSGRATFYPLTTIRYHGRGREYDNVSRCKGFIGYADELVQYDSIYSDIVKSLLAKTAVFDNLDNATDMARANNWRIKAVTLDGQQINQGGSFTGGQAKKDSGVLTRNNLIDTLIAERSRLEEEKIKLDEALKKSLSDTGRAMNHADALGKKKEELIAALTEEQRNLSNTLTKQTVLNDLIANLRRDNVDLEQSYNEGREECERLEKRITENTERLGQIEELLTALTSEKTALDKSSESLSEKVNELRIRCAELARDKEAYENLCSEASARMEARQKELLEHVEKISAFQREISGLTETIVSSEEAIQRYSNRIAELDEKQKTLSEASDKIEAELTSQRNKQKDQLAKKELVFIAHSKNEAKLNDLKNQHEKVSDQLWNDYELTYSSAAAFAAENGCETVVEGTRAGFVSRQSTLKNQIKSLGHVNLDSINEFVEVKERYGYIKEQLDDLRSSKQEIEKILFDLEEEMKQMFTDAFQKINRYFGEVFRELFGGGHAEVVLTDPENVLTSGIEINAAPPGKSVKNLNLLSGGEQSFIAIALLFALIKVNPSPFCIFDEVEAALDEVNVTRVGRYVKKYSNDMQFIMITHRRGTMEIADTLYGVTMPQSGVSKVFTLDSDSKNDAIAEQ